MQLLADRMDQQQLHDDIISHFIISKCDGIAMHCSKQKICMLEWSQRRLDQFLESFQIGAGVQKISLQIFDKFVTLDKSSRSLCCVIVIIIKIIVYYDNICMSEWSGWPSERTCHIIRPFAHHCHMITILLINQ